MKNIKPPVILLAAALAGGFTQPLARAAEGGPRHLDRAQFLERAKEQLGLTDEQMARIRSELAAEKETLKNLVTRMHEARVDLRVAIQEANATETSVREAAAKVGAAQADLAVERLKLHQRISPILTEEQREQVKQFQARIDAWIETAVDLMGERWQSR